MNQPFREHLREAGQSYGQHFAFAMSVAGEALLAGLAAAVHAVLPAVFQHTAGDRLLKLAARISAARRPPAAQSPPRESAQ